MHVFLRANAIDTLKHPVVVCDVLKDSIYLHQVVDTLEVISLKFRMFYVPSVR